MIIKFQSFFLNLFKKTKGFSGFLDSFLFISIITLCSGLLIASLSLLILGKFRTTSLPLSSPRYQPNLFLSLENPSNQEIITDNQIKVKGTTLPGTSVLIYTEKDADSVESDSEGGFEAGISLTTGINKLTVTAFADNGEEKSLFLDIVSDDRVKGEKTEKEPPGQEKKEGQAPQPETKTQDQPKNEQPPGQEKKEEPPKAIVGNVEKVTSDSIVVEDKNLRKNVETKVGKDTVITNQDTNSTIELDKIKPNTEAAVITKEEKDKRQEKVKEAVKIFVQKATSSAQSKRHGIQGVITNIEGNLITLRHQVQTERNFRLLTNAQTVIKIKNIPQPTLADLAVGQRINAVGDLNNSGLLVAKLIHVIPSQTTNLPTVTPVEEPTPTPTISPTPLPLDFSVTYLYPYNTTVGQYLYFGYTFSSPNTIPLYPDYTVNLDNNYSYTLVKEQLFYDGKIIYDVMGSVQTKTNWTGGGRFDSMSQPILLTEGTHTIKACIDGENVIPETNEENNCRETSFTVVQPLTAIAYPETDFLAYYLNVTNSQTGQYLSFSYTFTNPNTIPLYPDYTVISPNYTNYTQVREKLFYDGEVIYDQLVTVQTKLNWTGGGTFNTTIRPILITEGTHSVRICIDTDNKIPESNEENNCKETSFTAPALNQPSTTNNAVDLLALYLFPYNTQTGQYLSFSFTFSSPNTIPLYPDYTAPDSSSALVRGKLFYDGEVIYDTPFSIPTQLNWTGGFTFNTTIRPILVETGTHTIKACIDTENLIPEPNESNNCKEASFTAL